MNVTKCWICQQSIIWCIHMPSGVLMPMNATRCDRGRFHVWESGRFARCSDIVPAKRKLLRPRLLWTHHCETCSHGNELVYAQRALLGDNVLPKQSNTDQPRKRVGTQMRKACNENGTP